MATRTWFRVHSFAGVVAGLLLFVVCWTGTFATLSHEIDWLVTPAMRAEPADRFDPDALERAALAAHPGARLAWMSRPLHRGFAADVVLDTADGPLRHAHVAPEDARLQGANSYFNVQRFFRSLHMALFLPFGVGIYVVGIAAIFLLLSALTPLVFYKRWWTRFFKWRAHGGARVVVSESHKLAGLWSLWFVALIALTGVWYMVEQALIDTADVAWIYPEPPAFDGAREPRLPLSSFVDAAMTHRPELEVRSIGQSGNGLVYVNGQAGDLLARDRSNTLYFAPTTGALVGERRASALGPVERWVEMVDFLHFGTLAGLPTKLLWFLLGLALSGLCLTGAYLHARRLAASGARRARWAATGGATFATLLLLAFSTRGGFAEARRFGPMLDGVQVYPDLSTGVLAFIVCWTLATLLLIGLWLRWVLRAPVEVVPDVRGNARIRSPMT
jgi:uncharacterized iron-regulated membrane protein